MAISQQTDGRLRQMVADGELLDRYRAVRGATNTLRDSLTVEDCVVQSMPDVSPTRWHAAHTTWFFETFVLEVAEPDYRPYDPRFAYLFNSYYNTLGEPYPRRRRGLLSRPSVAEVFAYRHHVDLAMARLLKRGADSDDALWLAAVEIGLHHEQQHQELILTDIKHVFSCNPLVPIYREQPPAPRQASEPLRWFGYEAGLREMGHAGGGFAYDNESPRHRVYVEAFELAGRLATAGEYIEFIDDDGYRRPELWLSDGWNQVQLRGWTAPLYWRRQEDAWWQFTLSGLHPVDRAEPVTHISYFEADAFARWAGARLPTEAEWELAATHTDADDPTLAAEGNFVEDGWLHPRPPASDAALHAPAQLLGDAWEWTASPYVAYPGYQPPAGALGEYNGKFMCNQFVLRGGSCATPRSHIRATYRNFFPPDARWQFSGLRLAR